MKRDNESRTTVIDWEEEGKEADSGCNINK
jgi:hypothetical protein